MWDTIDPEDKEKLLTKAHDGAFWMTYRNWVKHFNEFSFCYLPTDFRKGYDFYRLHFFRRMCVVNQAQIIKKKLKRH